MTTLPARPSRTVAAPMPPADGRDRRFSHGPHRRRIHRVAHSGLWLMGSDRQNSLLAVWGWASVGMALSCVSAGGSHSIVDPPQNGGTAHGRPQRLTPRARAGGRTHENPIRMGFRK